jgi:endonuclease/exonuclease/phosphatase family metal-dependent hydrolase
VRIATYNIRLTLDSSIERVGAVIRRLKAEVVCLQEVGRHWEMGPPLDMRTALMDQSGLGHGVFVPALQRADAQYGIALLSRYPMAIVDRFPLPRIEDEPRVLIAARITAPDAELLVVTSHVSVMDADRPGQCRVIGDWIRDNAHRHPRMVLAGDLNAPLDSPEIQELLDVTDLRSAVVEAKGKMPPSFPVDKPKVGIDHILVSREIAVEDAAVARMKGSDHYPVWADLA